MKTAPGLVALIVLAASVVLAASGPRTAAADEMVYDASTWPLSVIERPLTLAGGMHEIDGDTIRLNLSTGNIGALSAAPDMHHGITDDFTLGLDHHEGLCLTGCDFIYHDVMLDARYNLLRGGAFELAGRGAIGMPSIPSPLQLGIRAGFIARLRVREMALVLAPGMYVGVIGRSERDQYIELPIDLQYQVDEKLAVLISIAVNGPAVGYGENLDVPLGVGFVFALNSRLDLGGQFLLTNLSPDGEFNAIDGRAMVARLAIRL